MEDADFIMGFEDNNDVNNAVMTLPVDSPVLADLCTIKEGWTPPWLTDAAVKPLPEYGWGVTGPRALTHYLQKHRSKYRAQPIDAFYPVHPRQIALFLDEDLTVADLITSRTRYIHLYQGNLSKRFKIEPPWRSVAGQLIAQSGI